MAFYVKYPDRSIFLRFFATVGTVQLTFSSYGLKEEEVRPSVETVPKPIKVELTAENKPKGTKASDLKKSVLPDRDHYYKTFVL